MREAGFARLGLGMVCAALFFGCAQPALQPRPESELRWPPPPLPARIEWVEEINDHRQRGTPKGVWRRMSEAVLGSRPAPFARPYGLFVDGQGKMTVVDTGAARVLLLERKGGASEVVGNTGEIRFQSPLAVTADDNQYLYISDSAAGFIYRLGPQKELKKFVRHRLGRPTGIAFSRHNRFLYVTDTLAHQIIVYDLAGIERFRIGTRGNAPGEFNFPTDLFIDRLGQLYVTDALNHRIQVFSPEGQHLYQFGESGDSAGYLPKPKGVAVDSQGHIYVVDALLDTVQIFDEGGRLLLDFGNHGSRQGEFWMPSGIFIDGNDQIYVADSYNQRIQVFRFIQEGSAGEAGLLK